MNMEKMTTRQCEILVPIAFGHSDLEISEKLGISIRTVGMQRKNIIRKLKLRDTVQLINYAKDNGLASFFFH